MPAPPVQVIGPKALIQARRAIVACEACPRLREYCQAVARTRRAAFRNDVYWGRPVPGYGDPAARLLILGLAPAAHGANRTGRVFTGDGVGASGDFLMSALHRAGLANLPTSQRVDDGLRLRGVFIAAAARCAPPANRPLPEEVAACRHHLAAEVAALPGLRRRRGARQGGLGRLAGAGRHLHRHCPARGRSSATARLRAWRRRAPAARPA